ncbi:TolC family protein [bacterium]|nr:MAG: TolC family protein [bacterium]
MNKKLLPIVLSVLSLLPVTSVYAAEVPASQTNVNASDKSIKAYLTLFDAIDVAVKNNYNLKISSERINVARYQITENAAQGLPQLTITSGYNRQDPISASQNNSAGAIGNNAQFAALLGTARVNTFQNQVALSQVLFAGFRIVDGIKLANMNVNLAEESFRQARHDVVSNVSTAYYNALKAYQLINVNKVALKEAEFHIDQAKKLEAAGVGIKLDVVRATNQLVNSQLQLSQSLNSYERAKKSLNLNMGRAIDYPIELNAEARVPSFEINEEKMLQDSLKNRSELKQLVLRREMDEVTTTIQSRGNWPTISASVNYNLTDTSVVNSNANNQQNLRYGVNMNWPIFDGLLTYAKVQRAQNTVIQDQISIDQQQQSIILEVKQALLDVQEAKERVILANSSINLAEESLKIARVRYDNGIGISLDVIEAQGSLNQAKINLVNAEFDLNIGRVKLYRAMGADI